MGWNVQPAQLQPTQPVQQSQFPSLMLPTQTAQKRKANEMSSSNKPQEEEYSNTAVSASSSSAGNSGGSKSRRSGNTPKPAKLAKTTQQVQPHVAGQQISSQHQAQQPPFAVSVTDSTGHFRQATESPPNNTIEDVTLGRGNVNTSANASPSNVPLSMQANSNEEKKRQEKNIREQKRSQQISQQIKELRQVLTESKVPFQKNKYSILMSVVDYIKNLQERAIFLDSEHGKLIHTIQQTSEFVNNGMIHHQDEENVNVGNDAELLYVQGLDYKAIFEQCVFPIAVAA
jgi:preprotein translocase subunit Sss1